MSLMMAKTTTGKIVDLLVDSTGHLEVNASGVELHAGDISIAVDGLETLQGTANTSLSGIKAEIMWANNHLTANTPANSLNTANDHHITAHGHQATHTTHLSTIATETASHDAEIQYQNNTGASGSLAHSLVAIKTAVEILDNTVSGNEIQCDIVSGTITLPSGASTEAKQDIMETSLDALILANHADLIALEATSELILSKNTEIDSELGFIKTAIQSIDDAVDGAYLNVNQNITGVDVDGNSGNKSAQTQRVCIATDDIAIALVNTNLGTVNSSVGTVNSSVGTVNSSVGTANGHLNNIATAVQLLDNAVDGAYINVNQNITGVDVDGNSGNKSAQTQRVCIATDDIAIALVNTNLGTVNSSVGTVNSSVGTVNSSVGTANGHLNNIATAVQLLDNAVDGAYINVNQNIAGTDVDGNSGNKSAQTQRVCIATDDVPFITLNEHLNEIEGAVETLEACVDSEKVNVNISSGNITGFATQTTVASILSKNTEIDSALDLMSAKLPASLGQKANASALATCRSSTAGAYSLEGRTTIGTAGSGVKLLCDSDGHLQIDVLSAPTTTITGTISLSATDNAVLDAIDAVLDTIKTDTEAIETAVELIDDAIYTDDSAITLGSSKGIGIMGFAGTQSVNANDAGFLSMTTTGFLNIVNPITLLQINDGSSVNAGAVFTSTTFSPTHVPIQRLTFTFKPAVISVGDMGSVILKHSFNGVLWRTTYTDFYDTLDASGEKIIQVKNGFVAPYFQLLFTNDSSSNETNLDLFACY